MQEQNGDQTGISTMMYRTIRVPVPTPSPVAKGVRVLRAHINLEVPVLVNTAQVNKGNLLTTFSKSPTTELPEKLSAEETQASV